MKRIIAVFLLSLYCSISGADEKKEYDILKTILETYALAEEGDVEAAVDLWQFRKILLHNDLVAKEFSQNVLLNALKQAADNLHPEACYNYYLENGNELDVFQKEKYLKAAFKGRIGDAGLLYSFFLSFEKNDSVNALKVMEKYFREINLRQQKEKIFDRQTKFSEEKIQKIRDLLSGKHILKTARDAETYFNGNGLFSTWMFYESTRKKSD